MAVLSRVKRQNVAPVALEVAKKDKDTADSDLANATMEITKATWGSVIAHLGDSFEVEPEDAAWFLDKHGLRMSGANQPLYLRKCEVQPEPVIKAVENPEAVVAKRPYVKRAERKS